MLHVTRGVQRSEAIDKTYPGSVENAVFAIRQGPLRTHSFHLAEPFLRAHALFLFDAPPHSKLENFIADILLT